jgi:serine/threonine protein phosphatase 1
MHDRYDPFEKVIRGFDPKHEGVHLNCVTATLDGGCGFGGSLVAGSMTADGEMMELLEV